MGLGGPSGDDWNRNYGIESGEHLLVDVGPDAHDSDANSVDTQIGVWSMSGRFSWRTKRPDGCSVWARRRECLTSRPMDSNDAGTEVGRRDIELVYGMFEIDRIQCVGFPVPRPS